MFIELYSAAAAAQLVPGAEQRDSCCVLLMMLVTAVLCPARWRAHRATVHTVVRVSFFRREILTTAHWINTQPKRGSRSAGCSSPARRRSACSFANPTQTASRANTAWSATVVRPPPGRGLPGSRVAPAPRARSPSSTRSFFRLTLRLASSSRETSSALAAAPSRLPGWGLSPTVVLGRPLFVAAARAPTRGALVRSCSRRRRARRGRRRALHGGGARAGGGAQCSFRGWEPPLSLYSFIHEATPGNRGPACRTHSAICAPESVFASPGRP